MDHDSVLQPQRLRQRLQSQGVNVLWLTVGLFNQMAQELADVWSQLRYLIVGGDALDAQVIRRVLAQGGPRHLINGYGPTESTTFAITCEIERVEEGARSIPIGRPIANTRVYILDGRGQPLPQGAVGEIHIAGDGLALGYLNQPQLTSERFVADPHGPAGQKMYRTGDLGRYLGDGNIEFLGRNDHQVKIRGFRIELGEIEARLTQCEGVREAVVLAREDSPGDKRLVAYVVGEQADSQALREQLGAQLPEYMVPQAIVRLDALPLTPNGKVDRKALPAPDGSAYVERGYEAPVGEVEATLARIWAEVLQLERVGRHDNFFELGGHSLLAVSVLGKMRRQGLHSDVGAMFAAPTLAALAATLDAVGNDVQVPTQVIPPGCENITPAMLALVSLNEEQIGRIVATVPGGATNLQDVYPLAPLQEGIFFHHLMSEQGDPYLDHMMFTCSGRDHVERLAQALQVVVDRHDILRTAVAWEGMPEPVQVVWRAARLDVEDVSLDPTEGDIAQQLHALFDPRSHHLDLRRAPMMRLAAAHDPVHGRWVVLWLFHHLLVDHTAIELMQHEMEAHLMGRLHELPAPVPYRNFVAQARHGMSREAHEAFFSEMLREVDEPTAPYGVLDVHGDGAGIVEASRTVDAALGERLRERARVLGVSTAALCHLAWAMVLRRLSGRDDVVFATVLFGRMHSGDGADRAVGLFINTLPLRVRISSRTASDSARDTHEALAQLMRHEHAPLSLAQRCSGVAMPTPLFSTLLNCRRVLRSPQAADERAQLWEGIEFLRAEERTNYPVCLNFNDSGEGFQLNAQVQVPMDAQRICGYLHQALEGLVDALEHSPAAPVRGIEVLPSIERDQLLVQWNATRTEFPQERCIHELFEEQAIQHPDAVAIVHGNELLSYRALNERANRLAHHLRASGVVHEARVAVCLQRGVDMVVALLATLKAGGAYVPLDPAFPIDRIVYTCRDAAPVAVITHRAAGDEVHSRLREALSAQGDAPVFIDVVNDAHQWSGQPATSPAPAASLTPQHLAHLIYTSGSTGRPKGVMIEHISVVNTLAAMGRVLRIEPADRVLALATVAFDIAGLEIFLPLTSGASIVMADRAHGLDPSSLADLLQRHDVTLMQATPTTWRMLLDSGWQGSRRLKALSGGEALSAEVAARLLPRVETLWNAYGPTETTIYSTAVQAGQGGRQTWEPGSIGRPLANTRLYVLDTQHEPVPVGVAGELYIGGAGVARGYFNQPGLSAERFIDDPFAGEADARMYRTGDLARYLPDGQVEYLGRNDFQVKIRGFRIELGEIETRLAQHPQVRQAVVLAREIGGDHRLVAYVVGDHPDAQALRAHLLAGVPEYMVPAAYVSMDALPLTPNGKVDRKALPAPDSTAYLAHGDESPVGETETLLAGLWAQVLGLDRVGRHDNFFELGGHSLLAVSLMERMRQAGLPADVRRLFGHPTVAALAASLGDDRDTVAVPANRIAPGCEAITPDLLPLVALDPAHIDRLVAKVPGGAPNVQDIYPLAPLQEGILFHHLMGGPGDAYLLPAVLAFDTRERLGQYLTALQAVVDRHDVLRTAFHWDDLPQPVQVVWRQARLSVEEVAVDASAGDVASQLRERFHPSRYRLPLDQAPLLRVFIAPDTANNRWVLLLLFHHLCADHTTLGIVQHEIETHLLGASTQLPAAQPFRNHVAQARLGVSNEEHEAFFRAMLADVDEPTAPYGLTEVLAGGFEVSEAHAELDTALAKRLRDCARAAGVSLATVCHLAWAQVLSRLSDRDDVVFGTVLFGRMHGGAGSDRATGMFINTLPIRLRVGEVPVREAVQQAHELLTQLLRHEHAPLALAQRCSGVSAPAPLFSALLNYRHSPMAAPGEAANPSQLSGIEMLHMEERTNYPLCLNVDDLGAGVLLTAQTPPTLDPQRLCAYMRQALQGLAGALESTPHALLRDVDVLPAQERMQLLDEWSMGAVRESAEAFPHEMIQAQAARVPLHAAVVQDGCTLSYADLNTQANRLARHLRRLGVRRDSRVAMCVERSADMVVGLLATLKAGGAYVPLDPSHPVERLAHMIGDSAPALVLTHAAIGASAQTRLLEALEARSPGVVVVDLCADSGRWADEAGGDLGDDLVQMHAEDMAYVVYTSGSTGVPKGVVNTIAGLANRLTWFVDSVLQAPPVTAFKTTIGFVDSVTETLQTLAAGGTLVVVDGPTAKDPLRLAADMQRSGVDTLVLVPSLLAAFMQLDGAPLDSLKTLVCSGERLPPALMHEVMARYPGLRLFNFYGSSEVNGEATAFDCREPVASEGSVIGRPIANMRVVLLDHAGRPVPAGAVGELYVGGPGLARGYLNRPDLTAERFIANPFADGPQDRLFKTGDLGRHRPDGSIEYLGRNDFQVKIRGQRVELGEIEQQLLRHGPVKEAVVLAREDEAGDQRLVAYLVADEAIDVRALREHLARMLPDHMVPAAFVPLDALPMTASGKLDRRALPEPGGHAFVTRGYEPPVGEVEALLARIWADVLKIERVGRHDNFFELGGHSLLAMNATARMRAAGLHAEMSAFFTAPTVAAFVHATQVEWEVSL
ncbi:non-ribosomal peptide synthetase [Piscinibacter terrae]|uniref:non-ribosomal peptide synthetase n=1 Tax=Piscinibacter terrae TaxID=2496871 RepID=UPI0022A799DD|nr:non-ribosomal peptide synthetase [Albitalea terrae]